MRARLMRSAVVLFGALAVAVGGCSSLGGGSLHSDSALLASLPDPPGEHQSAAAEEPTAAAVAAEPRAEAPAAARPRTVAAPPALAFVPVAFQAVAPEDQPALLVATVAPVVAQTRGTPTQIDPTIEEYDPWEPFNEKMFAFNKYVLDDYVLKPAAKGYNVVMPDLLQQMVDNGFQNINVVPRVINNLLQGRLIGAGTELGRFIINSTLGIGGLFDIARQEFGLQKTKADFGQTLGVWGAKPGPYLVLPLLPPMTVRDGIGLAVDGAMDPLSYFLPFIWDRFGMRVGDTINDRSLNLDLYQGFEETTVDLYSAVRNGYLQRRQRMIEDARQGR